MIRGNKLLPAARDPAEANGGVLNPSVYATSDGGRETFLSDGEAGF